MVERLVCDKSVAVQRHCAHALDAARTGGRGARAYATARFLHLRPRGKAAGSGPNELTGPGFGTAPFEVAVPPPVVSTPRSATFAPASRGGDIVGLSFEADRRVSAERRRAERRRSVVAVTFE